MGLRLLLTTFLLCGGLYGFLSSWLSYSQPEPTIWFHRLNEPGVTGSLEMASEVRAFRERQLHQCNELFIADLRRQRARLVKSYTPRGTLMNIVYRFNSGLSQNQAGQIVDAILKSSSRHNVDPFLVAALISQESRYKPHVLSPGGAVGLGQLLPGTAASLGVNPHDPVQNVEGCVKYLATQQRRWGTLANRDALALASYNAGPGAVQKYGGVPPYRITQNYVRKISQRQASFRAEAKQEKDRWMASNGPVMRDLFGAPVTAKDRVLSRETSREVKS